VATISRKRRAPHRASTGYVDAQFGQPRSHTSDEPVILVRKQSAVDDGLHSRKSQSKDSWQKKTCKIHGMVTPKKLFSILYGSGICNIQEWHNMTDRYN
jgi:hypothetical protein